MRFAIVCLIVLQGKVEISRFLRLIACGGLVPQLHQKAGFSHAAGAGQKILAALLQLANQVFRSLYARPIHRLHQISHPGMEYLSLLGRAGFPQSTWGHTKTIQPVQKLIQIGLQFLDGLIPFSGQRMKPPQQNPSRLGGRRLGNRLKTGKGFRQTAPQMAGLFALRQAPPCEEMKPHGAAGIKICCRADLCFVLQKHFRCRIALLAAE